MIEIIGEVGCSRCGITKQILESKHIEYKYKLFSELDNESQIAITSEAKDKGLMNFPIIIKDNKVVSLQEVLN